MGMNSYLPLSLKTKVNNQCLQPGLTCDSETRGGILGRIPLSWQLFPKDKKKNINRIFFFSFFSCSFMAEKGQTSTSLYTTPGNDPNSYGNGVKYVYLGAQSFENMSLGASQRVYMRRKSPRKCMRRKRLRVTRSNRNEDLGLHN